MKLLILAAISIAAGASGLHGVPGPSEKQLHDQAHGFATCRGGKCRACKNCKYCKLCKKNGGTCSVCKK